MHKMYLLWCIRAVKVTLIKWFLKVLIDGLIINWLCIGIKLAVYIGNGTGDGVLD